MSQKPDLPDVLDVADVMPVYPAGSAALVQYFKDNFVCPQYYKGSDRVIVAFVVEKDGYVSHPYIVQGVDEIIDGEALRLVESMPRWTPAVNDGRIVRVWQTVNINIRSRNGSKDKVANAGNNVNNTLRSSFYLGGLYGFSNMPSYGGNIGFYLNNLNVEGGLVYHNHDLNGIWNTPSTYRSFCVYTWKIINTASLKLGYGINLGSSIRLTPQVGMALTKIKCVEDESLKRGQYLDQADFRTFCLGAQAGAKLEYVFSDHMSLFVSPEYTLPIKMGDRATLLDGDNKSLQKYTGGFRLDVGLNFIF